MLLNPASEKTLNLLTVSNLVKCRAFEWKSDSCLMTSFLLAKVFSYIQNRPPLLILEFHITSLLQGRIVDSMRIYPLFGTA